MTVRDIMAEIRYKERKREKAMNDKCLRVVARYDREINALKNELDCMDNT